MPRHTDSLRADHHVVRQALLALRAIGESVRNGAELPVEDTASLLRFLREFLLANHFRKESEHLWPAVAMRGEEATAAQVGELLRLQQEVTDLVHSLVLFWEPVGELTAAERLGFADTIVALDCHMQHMRRIEEDELFAACDAAVPADDQLDWVPAFRMIDGDKTSRDAWSKLVGALQRKWAS